MIYVRKRNKRYPFSRGILARSISKSGLSIDESYELVREIKGEFKEAGIEEIDSIELRNIVSEKLRERGYYEEERYYRVRRQIKYLDEPIFILIGGGPGVGKSSISSEVGHRLGIERVIGSDTVREIMRSIISHDLIPTLHESSFTASDKLRTPFVSNKLIYAFEQQVSLASEGIVAVMNRGRKEGLNMVINGVHVVPGFIKYASNEKPKNLFQYVLHVPDLEQHIQHFYSREEGSLRDPHRYIDKIDRIREIQDYVLELAKRKDVRIVQNVDFQRTMKTILEDILSSLEEEMDFE